MRDARSPSGSGMWRTGPVRARLYPRRRARQKGGVRGLQWPPMAQAPKTSIPTGSPENFAATRERGFRLVGMKERPRNQALAIAPGDRIVFYLTRLGRFGASV